MPDEADAQCLDVLIQHRPVVGHRFVGAPGIGRVVSGDHLKHQRVVAHGAGHRTDMIEREGERHDAAAADPAIGWLHPGDAAHRGWVADRTAGVGAESSRKEPGSQAGAAAARRPAAEMVAVPRVARWRPGQVERRPTDGEFMGRELAEQDPAGGFQPLGDRGMRAGAVVCQDPRMRRRRDPLDIDDVLERVGHAVKRSAPTTGGDLGLSRPRRRECSLRRQCDEGVEFWVVALYPCQQRRRVLDRRQFLVADQLGGFCEAEIREIAAHGACLLAR